MRRPTSLATRLTLLFGSVVAIVLPLFGWVINRSIENRFAEGDTNELELIADAVEEALLDASSATDMVPIERRFEDILVGHHSASLYIGGADGHEIFSSPGPDLSPIAHKTTAETEAGTSLQWDDSVHTYRLITRNVEEGRGEPYKIAVAVPIDYHLSFLATFRRTLWLMIAGSIVIMSFTGWLVVRRGHAPLRDIVTRIRRISANELAIRVPPDSVPRDLSDLAVSFNEMLSRVDEAFHRLSDFNADIAHELRTPITNLMTQTQVAMSRARTIDEYREILYSNMEEYERMAQMIGDMLFLAQADSDRLVADRSDVDVGKEVRALFDYYEGWAEERGVSLELEGTAKISGDRLMLQRALSNLFSNAIRHTPSGQAVRVMLNGDSPDTVELTVENPGKEIPPEHLPKLFDRFYRVDPSRQRGDEGAGLGLAIVKSIVVTHGGTIDVSSAEGLTIFRVTFPKA